MAYQLSPGVNVSEIDLTTVVPATGASEGAIAGCFEWGPTNKIVTVSNEIELVDRFGKPATNSYVSFFSAANFLAYGNNLKVVRAANTSAALNACGSGGILIQNDDDYQINYRDMQAASNKGQFAAKYPGALGNGLIVGMLAPELSRS